MKMIKKRLKINNLTKLGKRIYLRIIVKMEFTNNNNNKKNNNNKNLIRIDPDKK